VNERVGMGFLDRPDVNRQIKLVQRVEELGYESAWITETRLARDAFTILGAFAHVTKRITLGTSIVNTWTRGPALMSVTFATLNEMAPGRMVMGLGAYWDPLAWKQGIERTQLMTQMREYIGVCRRLLALEEGVTFEGEVVKVRDLRLDLGKDIEREPLPVPIYIGATGPKMMELSGELADGVILNGLTSAAHTKQSVERIATGAERVGRSLDDIDRPQFINVSLAETDDAAFYDAHRLLTMYLGQQPHIGKASGLDEDRLARINQEMGGWPARPGGIEAAMKLVDREIVEAMTVSGTPDRCRGRLSEWTDAGASYPVIVPLSDNYEWMCEVFAPR
jgi:5,10-methylenetetrahydromethanopterin reductase